MRTSEILKRLEWKGREGEGRRGWIWRDGGAGESANIPGGEWPLEMPGWAKPTLRCHRGRGEQTRPPDGGAAHVGTQNQTHPAVVTDSPRVRQVVHLIFPSSHGILTGPSQCFQTFDIPDIHWSVTQTFKLDNVQLCGAVQLKGKTRLDVHF